MKLQRYKEFTNEGILSKGIELLNYKKIKENDKIAKEYLEMIYKDYAKKRSLLAAKITLNKNYKTISYKISEDPYAEPGSTGGDIDYLIIKFIINGYGLDSKTMMSVELKNGTNKYDNLIISGSQIEKLIKFFKTEYIKKYPELLLNIILIICKIKGFRFFQFYENIFFG